MKAEKIRIIDLLREEAKIRDNPALIDLDYLTHGMEQLVERLNREDSIYVDHASVAAQILRRLDSLTRINKVPY